MLFTVPFVPWPALWLIILSLYGIALAEEPQYVVGTINGQRMRVRDDRQPALYTADYGDCLGASAINVTRFDAAYYKDNMTIIFHLAGETALKNESIMMYIGVYAYGENRFQLTFNPCDANIESACPVQAGTPIEAAGIIPINQEDVSGIPDLALSIPDFEGEAILRLFSNSTQTEIGCFAAQITNGNTFQQKGAVGSVLGLFTLVAIISSFATAVHGNDVSTMRKHYAHSLSVLVVFAVWHHIFYSGALSMNWPSVLVAFWSNYAWAGGMVYSESMQNTINNFIGANRGNISHIGAAGTGTNNPELGGGYDIQQIYKRGVRPKASIVQDALTKRALVDATSGFTYYGQPVKPGLPLPGNYSGFAGTLAYERIPASNAFMTGLLWFLTSIACVVVFVLAFKLLLECLSVARLVRKDRLAFFRSHYIGYTAVALLRTLFIGFFTMAFLATFQLSYLASPRPVAVACVVLIGMVVGLGTLGGAACYHRIVFGKYVFEPDRLNLERINVLKCLPWCGISRQSNKPHSEDKVYSASIPWWTVHPMDGAKSIHSDESYTKSFGWLTSRYRKTRWWFFLIWMFYEFVRACLLAGASNKPTIQVFGLLIVEFIAFIGMIWLRPFEGQRLNVIVVYLLGFSKVASVALSAAFDTRFNLPRIPATVIGIIIIVIQGILTITVMLAIIAGVITSYMSIMRNREEITPKRWNLLRDRYFKNMDSSSHDVVRLQPLLVESKPKMPQSPYFQVNHVKRIPKVEDEDHEFIQEIYDSPLVSKLSFCGQNGAGFANSTSQRNRAASIQSQGSQSGLPRAARLHRASWSTQNYGDSQGLGRHRTMSNTMNSTFEGSAPPSSQALARLNQDQSRENIDRQSSFKNTDASPLSDITMPSEKVVSRLTSRSRSSSRPKLEMRISEEEVPSLPEKTSVRKASGDPEMR